jgi:hypothetical protein
MFVPHSNSAETMDIPVADVDLTFVTPSTPPTALSMGNVT